ncbi:hypothetical protein [Paraburkholderia sp. A1RI-2L]|uniref:hypothetical protein n=1 Tax=Paraburkholderia sp. A1RI-2L TaxID=3028367 RepID=UPI003BA06CC0
MLAGAHAVDFFLDEFTRLSAGRFAGALVSLRSLDGFPFGHGRSPKSMHLPLVSATFMPGKNAPETLMADYQRSGKAGLRTDYLAFAALAGTSRDMLSCVGFSGFLIGIWSGLVVLAAPDAAAGGFAIDAAGR